MKFFKLRLKLMQIGYIAEHFFFRKLLFFLIGFFIFEINMILFETFWQVREIGIIFSSLNFIVGISLINLDAFFTLKRLIYYFFGDILAGLIGILLNYFLIFR